MSRTDIKELALSLTEKHDLNKADAEHFVASIFDIINEGLEEDKLVKVKGLGSFKIIGIAARKSVDVNTGDPIIIESRDKISFTPDASMRDDVNKPFSQFETVDINDGVDFSTIDKEYENDEVITEKAQESLVENETTDETEPNISDLIEKDEPIPSDESARIELTTPEKPESTGAIESVSPENMGIVASEKPEHIGAVVSAKNEKEETKVKIKLPKPATPDYGNYERNDTLANNNTIEPSHKYLLESLAATAIVIAIGCVCGGYYLFSQIQKRDSHIEQLEKQVRLVAQHQKKNNMTPVSKHTHNSARQSDSLGLSEHKSNQDKGDAQPLANDKETYNKNITATQNDQDANVQAKYDQDPRIRTGAYIIAGIQKNVTAKPGQTMDGISKLYLGPGMSCYLEAVNGGRRQIREGESIKIPLLKLKKRLH